MSIGLFGAQNTGKTTLARAYAEKHGLKFVETSVSAIFRELGLDSSKIPATFTERLAVQHEVLQRLDAMYERYAGEEVIFDRCPLDLLGYTLAEALPAAVTDADQITLAKYMQACFDVLNKRFMLVFLVQPGIAMEEREGRGALNAGYIEHLNSLMLGLSCDERTKIARFYLPREVLDLAERVARLGQVVERVKASSSLPATGEERRLQLH